MLRRSLSFAWAVGLAAMLLAGVEKCLIATGHPTAPTIDGLAIAGGIVLLWAAVAVFLREGAPTPERWRRIISGEEDRDGE